MNYSNGNKQPREHRSTQNKIPARYVLTPTPPQSKEISGMYLPDHFIIGQMRFIDSSIFLSFR